MFPFSQSTMAFLVVISLVFVACVYSEPYVYGVLDCKLSVFGNDYSYPRSTTRSGKTCQRWDSQTPHRHTRTNSSLFPEDTLSAAENFCRNPDFEEEGPWCYTTDAATRWEYCDVDRCPDIIYEAAVSCRFTPQGTEYSGVRHQTVSGTTCQPWASQYPHQHQQDLANFTLVSPANNYCRNPDGSQVGPWCYTINPSKRWERCDIPFCTQSQWEKVVEIISSEETESSGGEPEGSGGEPEGSGGEPGGSDEEPEGSGGEPEGSGGDQEGSGGEPGGSDEEPEGSGGEPEGSGGEPEGSGGEPGGSDEEPEGSGGEPEGSGGDQEGSGGEPGGSDEEPEGSGGEPEGSGGDSEGSDEEPEGSGGDPEGSDEEPEGSGGEPEGSGGDQEGNGGDPGVSDEEPEGSGGDPEGSGSDPDDSDENGDKVSCWIEEPDHALFGHNDFTVFGVSVDECKRRCMSHTEFVCLSVDYTDDGFCALSRDSAETQPAMMGTHATATYWERVIPCDEEEGEEEGQVDINEELECFPGWKHNAQNQHCYKFEWHDGKNQADSKESCLADDAYLVQIEDRDELEYLEAVSREYSDWSVELYWTGGVRVNSTWFWEVLDSEGNGEHIPMTQDFWESGEPNNADDIENDAILAVHSGGHVGLNDFPASHRLRYICEKIREGR